MSSIDEIAQAIDTNLSDMPDPSSANVKIGVSKEEAAKTRGPKATPRTSTPKRKRIAKVNKNAKAMKKDKPKRVPFKDAQRYIVIRGSGKGTYAEVKGTEALYETAMHGYVSRIYKVGTNGDPTGKNLLGKGRMFKSGKMTFHCPEH